MAHLRDLRHATDYQHVVLSPHLDDAALSLGGTIAAWTRSGERALVVTICAGMPSPLLAVSRFAKELTGENAHVWVRARRREEARAMAELGADYYLDTALDAIFRSSAYENEDALFGRPDPKDSLHLHAFGLVSVLAPNNDEALFWAPLGVGGHVDHQIVCAAALRAVPRERARFYEDFPYLRTGGAVEARVAALADRGFDFGGEAFDIRETMSVKLRAIAAYKSQIDGLFGDRTFMKAAVKEHERETSWAPLIRSPRAPSRASSRSSKKTRRRARG